MANRHGQWGEDRAAAWLTARGYRIVARNWRSRFGELDIVAWDGPTLVCVEVKARSHAQGRFGTPQDALTPNKLRRLSFLAADFMARARVRAPLRLDVVTVAGDLTPRLIRGVEPVDINS